MKVVVFGAGGHGRVVADALEATGIEVTALVDDAPGQERSGRWQVVRTGRIVFCPDVEVALGVGNNEARASVYGRLVSAGAKVRTVIHPTAAISRSCGVGTGTVVLEKAVVKFGSEIGLGVIVNSGAVVTHDVVVGDFAHISPNATLAGGVRIGAYTHVGAGAVVLPGVSVGERAIVGAGAVVKEDVPPGATVVGVPARRIR